MDVLRECAVKFSGLINKRYIISLTNKEVINLIIKPDHFYHLIGLQYLTDLKFHNDKSYIFKLILENEITFNTISKSIFINQIMIRLINFIHITEIFNVDRIVKFNSRLSYSRINADYIMIKNDQDKRLMLFIGKNIKDEFSHPVSFIVRDDDEYIRGQKSVAIQKIEIID